MKAFKKILIIFGLSIIILFVASIKSNATSINSTDVTIYTCADQMIEYNHIMPSEYPTSFQLKFDGEIKSPKCKLVDNYSTGLYSSIALKVDETGLITPRKDNYGEYCSGSYKIDVTLGEEKFEVNVHLIEYKDIYTDNIIDDYIKNNITDSMTEYEKLEQICKFVASFEYSGNPSFRSMLIIGSGDCWASSYCIEHMCDKLGMKSFVRYAADEPGAGGGHRNVSVLADGKIYIVEASYNEKAPRSYWIRPEENGFLILKETATNKYALCKYDGFESNVIVPKYYDNEEVKVISANCFNYAVDYNQKLKLESITLPDSIETIQKSAFGGCKDLKKINIPKSVKELTPLAFGGCTSLKEIIVDEENPYFSYENGVIYNKDKTEVIMCKYSDSKTLRLNENVKTIKANAFSYCQSIDTVILGKNVETIESNAFYKGSIKSIVIPKNVKTIKASAFEQCPLKICKIEKGSNVKLESSSFYILNSNFTMIIPETVTDIDDYTTRENATIYGKTGSKAEEYAKQRKAEFKDIDLEYIYNNGIHESMVSIDKDVYDYDGTEKKPKITITDGSRILVEGEDYKYKIEDNINAGTAKIIITGIGQYNGEACKTFKIKRISNKFSFKCDDIVYGSRVNPVITENLSNGDVTYYFSAEGSATYTSVEPRDVGEYIIMANVSNTQNYYGTFKSTRYKILPAENTLEIRCENVEEGKQPNPIVKKNYSKGEITYYYKETNQDDSFYTKEVPTKIGKYTVKAISKATNNYKEGSSIDSFEITKKSIEQENNNDYEKDKDEINDNNKNDKKDNSNTEYKDMDYNKDIPETNHKPNENINVSKNNNEQTKIEVTNTENKIETIQISNCKIIGINNKTFTGKAQKQSITVIDGNIELKEGTDYIVTYNNNKKVGKAIVAITGKGAYTGTITKTFKINPKGTSLKKLKTGKKQFKATWKKQKTETTGYQIQYSTNKNFKSSKTSKIKKNKTTSSTVKKLKAKKKYYVRIRTYKTVNGKTYYSGWSKVKKVTTKK